MTMRRLGDRLVRPVGLGCMNLSHGYGRPPERTDAIRLLHAAIDAGYDHFDTAALYGFGSNEELLGEALAGRRDAIFLASKCGMAGVDGKRVIDGRPETITATVEASLRRLRTDCVDLLYLHRRDFAVPIADSVGAMSRLVEQGKVRHIGLSEVSAATVRAAHDVHPIAAVQSEYSLWSRDVEIGVLAACADIGAALVAFSPLGRGLLSGAITPATSFHPGDIRAGMPRFQGEALAHNFVLAVRLAALAAGAGMTAAQLCLAWVLSRGAHVHALPGTASLAHMADNLVAQTVSADPGLLQEAASIFAASVSGDRYPASTYSEIDTERA